MERIKCLIWGAGNEYEVHFNQIKYECMKGNLEIQAIISRDKWARKIDGYLVIDKTEIAQINWDYIIVFAKDFERIVREAMEIGILREYLIKGTVFEIPCFDMERYCKIRESCLTIISDNCWGGVLSNLLDLSFRSPFVNCWLSPVDFVTLLEDFEEYMSQELVCEQECNILSCRIAIGSIDVNGKKVKVNFNHHPDFASAELDWNRRKKRINLNNIFIKLRLVGDDNNEIMQRFHNLSYENKVCLTTKQKEYDWEIGFPYYLWRSKTHSLEYGSNTFAVFENNMKYIFQNCDIFKLLNGENDFRRME